MKNYFLKKIRSAQKKMYFSRLYEKYSKFTMVPLKFYLGNLDVIEKYKKTNGDVVECGVWKGGMIASIAEILGDNRTYHLFDSFEGLPPVQEIDGESALFWQANKTGSTYYDNCSAEEIYAKELMNNLGVKYSINKGWFHETLPIFNINKNIDVLRLDGDWYESTLTCLKYLYPKMSNGGIVIIDDYYTWDGCSRAVHDYLAQIKSKDRIRQGAGFAYIVINQCCPK